MFQRIKNFIYFNKLKNKYRKYGGVRPASDGHDMDEYYRWIREWSTLTVRNVVEIGANYGQDAERLRYLFDLKQQDIYIFEAHPEIAEIAKKLFGFNTYQKAVFDEVKDVCLHAVHINDKNTGISTIMKKHAMKDTLLNQYNIQSIRMDRWMEQEKINYIDFCKIDVEDATYNVLAGFGDRIADVNAIQLESEHENIYENGKLWPEIELFMEKNEFEMALFTRHASQSDSLWIKKKYLKNP